ncbi:MAG: chromosome partitioning protein [Flavobacteriales bacterium]|nr:chromosome partitioning protein [Flavobacteriales bacterium]
MNLDKKTILNQLVEASQKGFVSLNDSALFKSVNIENEKLTVNIEVKNPSLQFKNKIQKEIKNYLLKDYPTIDVSFNFSHFNNKKNVDKTEIKNIIAIASGKGGVGKSTISSNLAVSLQKLGFSVGLIDADIYGPSIPLMFDAEGEKPRLIDSSPNSLMSPVISYGVKIMSIGFFAGPNQALVWRGPMATKALKQIITETYWGDLDYLLIDLPPGTGDIHLSLVQSVSVTGAIVVTTPQPVSIIDAKKAIKMFTMDSINVPVLGLVENMSWYLIENQKKYVFGRDGGRSLSEIEKIPLLLELPLNESIREAGDVGRPAALQDTELGEIFKSLAVKVAESTNKRNISLPNTKKVEITHNKGCN